MGSPPPGSACRDGYREIQEKSQKKGLLNRSQFNYCRGAAIRYGRTDKRWSRENRATLIASQEQIAVVPSDGVAV
jgi:hypothetical protein